jgi:serine phosphatase RsbU (regulator of sigma subunit)
MTGTAVGWRLIVVSEREHSFFDVGEQPVKLGRAPDNDIVIKDDMASRRHCVIERDPSGDAMRIRDLKSFNGTYLNERRIREEPYGTWDALRIGRTKIFLVERGAMSGAPSGSAPLPPSPAGSADALVAPIAADMDEKAMSATRQMDASAAELLQNKDVRRVIDDLLRREREDGERETARRLRDESAPAVLAALDGLAVRARRYGPADGGGDFFDVFQEPERPDELEVALGTVSGAGIAASVAASSARHAVRGVITGRESTPRELADSARDVLARTLHPGSAVSLLVARMHGSGRTRIAALGGTGVLRYDSATDSVEVLRAPSRRDEEAPRTVDIDLTLRGGDLLVLCSDGAGALRKVGDADPLGVDRLQTSLRELAKEPPKEVAARLAALFEEYSCGAPDRDATIVVVALSAR